jgi:hypothetical protein
MCMCKGSLLVRITFSFSLFFSLSFSARSFLLVVRCSRQNGLGAAQIYTYAKRGEIVQAVFSFFSILFRVTVHSYMYACARSMNGYNITYKHTHIHIHTCIIKRKEAKLRPEQKTCSNFFFSFPPLFVLYQE